MHALTIISAIFVISGVLAAMLIALDLRRRPQPMRIMDSVWVLTGLWAGPLGLWAYLLLGRVKPNSRNTLPPEPAHHMRLRLPDKREPTERTPDMVMRLPHDHIPQNRIGTRYANRHFGTERIFEKGDRIGSIYKKYEQGAGFNDGRNGLLPEMAIGGSLYAPLRSRMHPGRSDRRMVHLDRPDFDRRQPDTRKLGSGLPAGSGLRHRFSVCRDPKHAPHLPG